MISRTKQNIYYAFIFFMAVWMGSGFFSTVSDNYAWYTDPLNHVSHVKDDSYQGTVNPWPVFTVVMTLSTLAALIAFIPYKGEGKNSVMVTIGGTLVVLLATFLYFVPALISIFGEDAVLTNDEIIAASRQWVVLNVIRMVIVSALFIIGVRCIPVLLSRPKIQ